jgi:hypothetical protein
MLGASVALDVSPRHVRLCGNERFADVDMTIARRKIQGSFSTEKEDNDYNTKKRYFAFQKRVGGGAELPDFRIRVSCRTRKRFKTCVGRASHLLFFALRSAPAEMRNLQTST